MTDSPRIYVASLSDYNAGRLHGVWIEADQDVSDIQEAVDDMLKDSREMIAEEYAIHDYEGFGPLHISEWDSLETVATIAEAIAEHGDAFAHYAEDRGDIKEAAESFEDAYIGEWPSMAEYVAEYFESTHDIPSDLAPYIDYESIARDWETDGYNTARAKNGNVYIFQSV